LTALAASQDELVPGYRFDRYELIHPVARGGMATVWIARLQGKHGFERMVALKTILPTYAQDLRFRNMFLDEARIASRVEHANVAQILDLGEQEGNLYLVMEWVDGDSLSNLARAVERAKITFPMGILLRILADACAGLHAAHELCDVNGQPLGVVHRDISPQNILVGANGVVKVIDFGVAKAAGRVAEETSSGTLKGKLHYMAPEQAMGTATDRRADLWAIGAVLYRILAGRPPYEGDNAVATLNQLISKVRPPSLPSTVPSSVARVVSKALATDPNERYTSAAELQAALEGLLRQGSLATTSREVASFVNSTLGPQLATRRAGIAAALEGTDRRNENNRAASAAATASESGVMAPKRLIQRFSSDFRSAPPLTRSGVQLVLSSRRHLVLLGAAVVALMFAFIAFLIHLSSTTPRAETSATPTQPQMPSAAPIAAPAPAAPAPEPSAATEPPVIAASALPLSSANKEAEAKKAKSHVGSPRVIVAPKPRRKVVDDGF